MSINSDLESHIRAYTTQFEGSEFVPGAMDIAKEGARWANEQISSLKQDREERSKMIEALHFIYLAPSHAIEEIRTAAKEALDNLKGGGE